MKCKLKPSSDRVIVRRDEPELKSPGGIILPDQAQKKPLKGTIVAAGTRENACQFQPGDVVLFSGYSGSDVTVDGESFLILDAKDVLATVDA